MVVLERHFKLGGFNHAFTRRGYHWDIGIHYVGGMAPGRRNRRLMDLATGGAVDWHRLPDEFDVFHYPDLTWRVPSDPTDHLERLVEAFPEEREALEGYRADLKAAAGWYTREFGTQLLPRPVRRGAWHVNRKGRDLALMTAREYLEGRFRDPLLRAVLTSQWGDYAVPPGRVSFAMHALLVLHYDWGAYYPVGGSDRMTDAFVAQVERAGGWARPDHEVTGIIDWSDAVLGDPALDLGLHPNDVESSLTDVWLEPAAVRQERDDDLVSGRRVVLQAFGQLQRSRRLAGVLQGHRDSDMSLCGHGPYRRAGRSSHNRGLLTNR